MENATKALIIAGTVLIALLVISLGVYLFNTYSNFAYEEQERQAKQEKIQFNTKFEKYEETDLTMQDVITIVNLAKEYNLKYEESGNRIAIYINNSDWTKKENDKLIEELQKSVKDDIVNKKDTTYIIEGKDYDDDGIINEVRIKEKNK